MILLCHSLLYNPPNMGAMFCSYLSWTVNIPFGRNWIDARIVFLGD